ncbi:acetyl-CoA C-acetyltransferase [Heyndrickxia coagulans]|uniref:acetyl-CoA C-acetyltransferase n=1 Tax=Heyndrickxia coagulans TaxID=1398 RepID=UPI00040EA920|nr:acetyl-CoA C-acetyltransferase [Heyndrickxia coagulans]
MHEVAIISAVRTPIGKFGGSLKDISAVELGAIAAEEAIRRAGVSAQEVDYAVFGNVLSAGLGQNPARQMAVRAGIPYEVPAVTVNEVCGSGLKAVLLAAQMIQLGEAKITVAGGAENMSRAPFLAEQARWGHKLGNMAMADSMLRDGLTDAFEGIHMGLTAESVATKFGISREEQDRFALRSQQKAAQAQKTGRFKDEIVPVKVKQRRSEMLFSEDEHVRPDTTLDGLAKLKPAFLENGTVTAGNASGINDGAAAVVLMEKSLADEKKIPYFGVIKGYAEAGVDPSIMGYAPYYAIQKLLEKTGASLEEVDLIELNEAFASQSLAVIRDLGLDPEKVNVNGGAIALGHPIGASGARILVSLLHEMEKRNVRTGLASLCVGGGIGISMLVGRT